MRNPPFLTREEGKARVELPWPDRELQPNARVHWAKKARYTRKARRLAGWSAASDRSFEALKGKPLTVTAVFVPPDNRRRDDDNLLAACKAYFDGIADVVGDDSNWTVRMRREPPRAPGSVCIEVEVKP